MSARRTVSATAAAGPLMHHNGRRPREQHFQQGRIGAVLPLVDWLNLLEGDTIFRHNLSLSSAQERGPCDRAVTNCAGQVRTSPAKSEQLSRQGRRLAA